jgi:hypothetical protein
MNATPFRNPAVIDALLSDTRNYNVFFVCSHGALVENQYGGKFEPKSNNILIFTGAGEPGFPIFTNKAMEKEWMNLFDPSSIKTTFAAFLGLYHGHTELLYKVPHDATPSPGIYLTMDDTDRKEDIGFWGVFRHTGQAHSRRHFSNIEELPELTTMLYEGLLASMMMYAINARYKTTTNILFFLSCRNASRLEGTRLSDYTESASILLAPSHFMLQYVPSGLDTHVPPEEAEQREEIVVKHRDTRILLRKAYRNQTVKELIQFLRANYRLFDYNGVQTLLVVKPHEVPVILKSDVLFDSQWDDSYLTQDGDEYVLRIYPYFKETHPRNMDVNTTKYHNPEHIEAAVSRHIRTRMDAKRPTRGGRRTTRKSTKKSKSAKSENNTK